MNSSHLQRSIAAAAAGILVLLLTGCDSSKTYTVQVDAIAQPAETGPATASAQSYHIRSQNPQLEESSLRYKEVADYVRTALSGKGMYEAPTPEKADVVIDIDYGMDAPRIKFETISQPIIVQQPGRYVTETRYVTRRRPDGTFETVEVQTQVYVPGTTEFLGMQESVHPVVVYEKFLKLSARENREATEGRAPPEVWSVNVSAEDNSQELRKYMPILASATADYIGTNTKESKPVKINEGDEVVTFIKKGM
ncbi:hypothetical protein ESB00_02225 [Oleiharenicola lentus]|uniref:DUF4136 domain-containing protein n=1 Tax=Oleiharenicola lentus TaxID=2508720 RepID=A0A4Q1C762_9BACT|nr:hypothetical protein [Oleiharenicola lentus]RXK54733.1 hypothetical protein ESB00_02225 [Oleiharenicola lentus]